jgi:hypothetical protein
MEMTFRMSAPLLLTLQEIANLAGVKIGDVVSVVLASEVVRSRRNTPNGELGK